MAQWYREGFLPDFVQVRRAEESHFFPIRNRVVAGDCPFVFSGRPVVLSLGAGPHFASLGPFLGPNNGFEPIIAAQQIATHPIAPVNIGFMPNLGNFRPNYPHFSEHSGFIRPNLRVSAAGANKKKVKTMTEEIEERKRVVDSMAKLSQTLGAGD